MAWFCQLPKPGHAISSFLLPKKSFINFLPVSETGTERGPRLARDSTEASRKSWPSPAFSPPPPLSLHRCWKCHLCSSTGGRGWATAPQAQDKRLPRSGPRTTGFKRTGFALSCAPRQLRDLRQVPKLPCGRGDIPAT